MNLKWLKITLGITMLAIAAVIILAPVVLSIGWLYTFYLAGGSVALTAIIAGGGYLIQSSTVDDSDNTESEPDAPSKTSGMTGSQLMETLESIKGYEDLPVFFRKVVPIFGNISEIGKIHKDTYGSFGLSLPCIIIEPMFDEGGTSSETLVNVPDCTNTK